MKGVDWYDRVIYESVKDYSLRDWVNALEVRMMLLECMMSEGNIHGGFPSEDFDHRTECRLIFHRILIGTRKNDYSDVASMCDIDPAYRNAVEPINLAQLSELSEEASLSSPVEQEESTFDVAISPPLDTYAYLRIDLNFSNDQIKRELNDWLVDRRKGHGVSGLNITENKLSQWAANQILPCIDVLLWSKIEKEILTHEQIGRLLFPNIASSPSEKVRKTVVPRAVEFLTYQFIEQLIAQLEPE